MAEVVGMLEGGGVPLGVLGEGRAPDPSASTALFPSLSREKPQLYERNARPQFRSYQRMFLRASPLRPMGHNARTARPKSKETTPTVGKAA